MGTQAVRAGLDGAEMRTFMNHLLADLRALEMMIEAGDLALDRRRIGAEQELFLIDDAWRPACVADAMIAALDDPRFTTELARFNLEFNLDPLEFGGKCLSHMESQIEEMLALSRDAARKLGADILMTGILPTLQKSDLDLENMTDRPRYFALNDAMSRLRGAAYEFRIQGIDEVSFKHYSVMLEACNTSFQVHFQVGADEFARLYNLAQVVTAPVLAAATNSPLLFGRRLWRETRIALFQQSIDTRVSGPHLREVSPRVRFGDGWVRQSVTEIFQEDLAKFRVILGTDVDEDPLVMLANNEVPKLRALLLHNSTVYRWNRPCYGLNGGKPHLRIENRVIPAGPTPADEVANAALWFGLMSGLAEKYPDVTEVMSFDDAKANFVTAARQGLSGHFRWLDGEEKSARRLLLDSLLPLAREGLQATGIDGGDIERYFGILEERIETGKTGAAWQLESLSKMQKSGSRGERLGALAAATLERQLSGAPGHEWKLAEIDEAGGWQHNYQRVEQYMTTDLVTVDQEELLDLVANLMDWNRIRHIPIEDSNHRLVGLISYRSVLRHLARRAVEQRQEPGPVKEVMRTHVVSVAPETTTLEAIEKMRKHRVACLPVVKEERLVGIITEHDFIEVARDLLEEYLDR